MDGVELAAGGPFDATSDVGATIVQSLQLPSGGCYQFIFLDSWGDGICCGYGEGAFSLEMDQQLAFSFSGPANFRQVRRYFGNAPGCPSAEGCGNGELDGGEECDEGVNNSDQPGATCTTTCRIPDTVPTSAPTSGPTSAPIVEGDKNIKISITTDNYGAETTWFIRDSSGAKVLTGGPYSNIVGGASYEQEFAGADTECYTFVIEDSYGDGNCCSYGRGGYTIDAFGTTVADNLEFRDDRARKQFGNCG